LLLQLSVVSQLHFLEKPLKNFKLQLRGRTSWARVVLHSVHAWLVVVSKRPNQRSRSLVELAQGMCIHTSFQAYLGYEEFLIYGQRLLSQVHSQEHQRRKCEGSFLNSLQQISYLGVICFKPENQRFL
jgi:hypothetical protein